MKNKIFNILFVIVVLTISSCASKKELVYLSGDQQSTTNFEQYIPKIQSSDILAISVSAADIKATEPFNQQSVYQVNSGMQNNPKLGIPACIRAHRLGSAATDSRRRQSRRLSGWQWT